MRIYVNGESVELQEDRLADVLAALGYTGKKVAVAVNETFVAKPDWGEFRVEADDRLDVLAAIQGG